MALTTKRRVQVTWSDHRVRIASWKAAPLGSLTAAGVDGDPGAGSTPAAAEVAAAAAASIRAATAGSARSADA